MSIIKEKATQVFDLLRELDLDMWLVFVRETSIMADPVLPLVVGHEATWQSFFMYTREGEAIAMVGNLDQENFVRSGIFSQVVTYTQSARAGFRQQIARIDPGRIAVNFSSDNPSADGLTHGMYLKLKDYLDGTPYGENLVSADELCSRLRSRKTDGEIQLISQAAALADRAWKMAVPEINTGMTEREVAAVIDARIADLGSTNSFSTIANAGAKTSPGHGMPSDAVLEPGDLLHVDFGAVVDGYCSDLQRLLYFPPSGEKEPTPELNRAFETVRDIVTATAAAAVPGKTGFDIDSLARKILTGAGYPEYQHALGHQLGRAVHDGGALLGPRWERYGRTIDIPLEIGNVFTLELEISLPGIGCIGLEEDVRITEKGAEFLCPRQTELTTNPSE